MDGTVWLCIVPKRHCSGQRKELNVKLLNHFLALGAVFGLCDVILDMLMEYSDVTPEVR